MPNFKEMVAADNLDVFLNTEEFAERRVLRYDGETYAGPEGGGIPVVLSGLKEQDRRQLVADHGQGLFLVTSVLHCALEDLGGRQPEKGQRIQISGEDSFFREFYVASSVCELGMLRLELEAIGE